MGKGDKKTRRGKIRIGTYGVRRRHKKPMKRTFMIKSPEVKAMAVVEEKPLVEIPEAVAPVEIIEKVEEKAPRKAAAKKSTAKKTPAKPVKEEVKPKAAKSKKKTTVKKEEKAAPKKEIPES